MSQHTLFVNNLIQAIAHAPSQDEALRLWDATIEPVSLIDVLGSALAAHNSHTIRACHTRLEGRTLTPTEQGAILLPWRTTPSNRARSPQNECEIAHLLGELGLVSGEAMVPGGAQLGPLTFLIHRFREHAAITLIEYIHPNQADLAGALCLCAEKLASGPRRDHATWETLSRRLLTLGADPNNHVAYKPSSTSTFGVQKTASEIVIDQASNWEAYPADLLFQMLGKRKDQWTQPGNTPHTDLFRWIYHGQGSVEMGIHIGEGQHLPLPALQCILAGQWTSANKKNSEAHLWRLFDGRLNLDQITIEQMTHLTINTLLPVLGVNDYSLDISNILDRWMEQAAKHIPTLLPFHIQDEGRAWFSRFSKEHKSIWKAAPSFKTHPEQRQTYLMSALMTQIEAATLQENTATISQQRPSPRL